MELRLIAEAGAAAAACAAIFYAAAYSIPAALFSGGGVVALGLAMRTLTREVEGGALRDPEQEQQSLATRLSPFYAFALASVLVFFPDPAGPRAMLVLCMAEVPLLAFSLTPRVRNVADLNAGLLVAAANAARGGLVPVLTGVWLALWALGLALRHLEDRADAAGIELDEPRARRLGLRIGGGASLFLLAVYLGLAYVIPPPTKVGIPLPRGARVTPGGKPVILPLRAIAELLCAVGAGVLVVVVYHRFFGPRVSGILRQAEDPSVELLAVEPLAPGPAARDVPRAYGARAEVIAEYRRFEAGAAARDHGRASSEGAGE
ncbi:MAG TPA: hypothetical protein VHF22_00060, partial [Planctomycetota bacterium]|nr:hypothetical protein [Planctomycetota bacterium]